MRASSRGFTLLEILVALAVLGIALGASIQAIGQNTGNASYLRDRTLAHWVAMNKVAEWQSVGAGVKVGKDTGTEEMANHEWFWSVVVTEATVPELLRLDIEVRRNRNDGQALATLIALVGKSGV